MESAIRILHLEDNLSDSQLVRSALKRANVNFEYFLADNEKDFISALENQKIDLILSDYHLPDYSGSEALLFAKNNYQHLPFVFLSGTMGEEVAIESLLNGATDYVLKNRMGRLVSAIHRAFNEAQAQKARFKAEEDLHQSEENFRHSISESPLGIRIVSDEGKTIYANKAFLDIYEFGSLEEFIGTPDKNRYTPESYIHHQEIKEKRKKGQDVSDYEISILRKDGGIRHVMVSRKEVLWNGIKHYQFINQDITEHKRLTTDLIEAKEKAEESERLKSAFLANMSHEIRTPMNGILGFAGLLKEPNLTGEEQQQYISIIEKSGARMLNIINDIVDISKIEAGLMDIHIKESNVNEQIEYIYTFFKPEVDSKGIELIFKNGLPSKEACIKTDREKLFAILTNLVKNAIKFSFGGTIEFGYVSTGSTTGSSGAVSEPVELQFFVKDNGIGIPKDRQEAIFERFVQADIGDKRAFQGAGLGLSITKAYIEMLGGKIWVESEEGKGSVFYFTLPYNVEPEKTVIKNTGSDVEVLNQIKPLKILIAEDDEGSAMLIAMNVKKFSKVVLTTRTGDEAVEICRSNPDIDLVLMDIKMPVLDGYEATRLIRQFNKDVVIIAQTAYALIGDREKAIEVGCNDYISKPIKKDHLLELLQRYFKN
ncbi:MAG: response regulator [Bacteroidia bacterium]|nr:response regulator [Bacteroidia bacterium]